MDTEVSASCELCGKTYTGEKATSQLRGHSIHCPGRMKGKAMGQAAQTKTEAGTASEPALKPTTLTAEERAIAERVAQQDIDWMTISEEDMEDFSLMSDPMELPGPAKKAQQERRYAFHWAQLTPQRIDQLTKMANPPLRWALCTRTTFPELAPWINDAYGCVTKADCALVFKPWAHHAKVMEAKASLNKAYEDGSGIEARKNAIASRDDDVKVYSGEKYKIDGSDQVLADEESFESESAA
jgi:hypothetical protein